MSTVKDYAPTQYVQTAVGKFEAADSQFKTAWSEFYDRHQTELDNLDQLRESRNVALDDATKVLRDEVKRLDIKFFKTVKYGPFQVSKKVGSDTFRAVEFVNLAKTLGFKKAMEDEGAIATKVEINFDAAKEFLKKNSLEDKFATTLEGGEELTPAVTGPKPVPGFGQETKAAK